MITSVMGVLFAGFTGALLAQGLIGIVKASVKKV
ncbi:hypothetical protein MYO4S_00278 [Serratia phage 4S]|nr:hypothetical protein MYO4S_00278 [Serratia phage 4S]